MSNTQAQFSVLRQTADPAVVDAISQLIEKGEDRELNRINLLDFAGRNGLDEEKVISASLQRWRPGDGVSMVPESPASGQGDDMSAWLVKDPSPYRGEAGGTAYPAKAINHRK